MYRTSRLSMRIVGIWIIISCHLTAITLLPKCIALTIFYIVYSRLSDFVLSAVWMFVSALKKW